MRVLDLFCGTGGIALGFKNAKYQLVCSIDIWDKAINNFKENFDHLALCKDLTKYTPEELFNEYSISNIDIITGGIPCVSFSNAGRRDPNDPRDKLYESYLKYVEYYNPKILLIENVVGLLTKKNTNNEKIIDLIVKELSNLNYNVQYKILNSVDYNTPQSRKRLIIIGIRKDISIKSDPFPDPITINQIPVKNILIEPADSKLYLSQRAIDGVNRRLNKNKEKGYGYGANFQDINKPSRTITARYYKDYAEILIKESEDKIRGLSVREAARIQSFPDTFKFTQSKKNNYIMIGNSVSVNMFTEIAKKLNEIVLDN